MKESFLAPCEYICVLIPDTLITLRPHYILTAENYIVSRLFCVVAEGLVEVPTSGCEASSINSVNYECERAIDRLPGTDWATSGEVVNC